MKKKNVSAALGLGSTWFCHAERGAQLVSQYGEGENAAQEVQKMLAQQDTKPEGSKVLLDFLQKWHVQHGASASHVSPPSPE